MPRVTARPEGPVLRPQVRWLLAPAAVFAVYGLYSPLGPAAALLAALLASVGALAVLTGWRPPRRRKAPGRRVHKARVQVVKAAPAKGLPGETYELTAFGVSVLVRLREDGNGEAPVPYVHVKPQAEHPRLLLVEVDNQGETEYR